MNNGSPILIPSTFASFVLATIQPSLLDKTIKTGQIARTCSIFGVEKIYIYNDQKGKYENDREILKKILFYAETPQYLRKKIFGNIKELQYVGTLPPLQTPHHRQINNYSELTSGEIREGIIEKINEVIILIMSNYQNNNIIYMRIIPIKKFRLNKKTKKL